jgi:hypothetical protein
MATTKSISPLPSPQTTPRIQLVNLPRIDAEDLAALKRADELIDLTIKKAVKR